MEGGRKIGREGRLGEGREIDFIKLERQEEEEEEEEEDKDKDKGERETGRERDW